VYIDDVLSIYNPNFANWIQLICLQRTWDKIDNRKSFICPNYCRLPQIWHQRSTLNQTFCLPL
jgi:hypothetical protein